MSDFAGLEGEDHVSLATYRRSESRTTSLMGLFCCLLTLLRSALSLSGILIVSVFMM